MDEIENEANYDASKYRTPDGAPSDMVILTMTTDPKHNDHTLLPRRQLEVLLIKRKGWPFAGQWALPGGFCDEHESMYDCARRELEEETGVKDVYLEYFGVYSEPGRDPRGWIISHAFFALVHEKWLEGRKAADDAEAVALFPVAEALQMNLAFDHNQMLADALQKVREKMLTTTIASEFLPDEFTIRELCQVIRTVVPEFEAQTFIDTISANPSVNHGAIELVVDRQGVPQTTNRYSKQAENLYRFSGEVPQLSIYE